MINIISTLEDVIKFTLFCIFCFSFIYFVVFILVIVLEKIEKYNYNLLLDKILENIKSKFPRL